MTKNGGYGVFCDSEQMRRGLEAMSYAFSYIEHEEKVCGEKWAWISKNSPIQKLHKLECKNGMSELARALLAFSHAK